MWTNECSSVCQIFRFSSCLWSSHFITGIYLLYKEGWCPISYICWLAFAPLATIHFLYNDAGWTYDEVGVESVMVCKVLPPWETPSAAYYTLRGLEFWQESKGDWWDVQLHLFPSFTILSVSHAQCSTTCASSCLLLLLAWWTRMPCHFAVFHNLLSAPFTNLPDKIVVALLTCMFCLCMSSSSYVKRTWERTVLKCHNLDWQNWTAMFQSPAPMLNWTKLSSHSSRSADLCVCVWCACLLVWIYLETFSK